MAEAGLDPTFINGGIINSFNSTRTDRKSNPTFLVRHPKAFVLNIGIPAPSSLPVRVRYIIPKCRFPSGYLTNLRHFKSLSIESFKEDLEINFIGLIKSLKSVLKNLTASNSASIVLFSTAAVQRGMPFHSSVSSAKGAIEGLAKSLAAELSPKIRVNVIAPSLVNTPLANRFLNNDNQSPDREARLDESIKTCQETLQNYNIRVQQNRLEQSTRDQR